ncbi:MAG: hypothetical protein ACOX2E_02170 [Syntrophaceticus sp.]
MKRDIEELEKRCNLRKNVRKNVSNLQRLKTIEEFFEQWDKLKTKEEKNRVLKAIIDRIEYERDGDDVQVRINFL